MTERSRTARYRGLSGSVGKRSPWQKRSSSKSQCVSDGWQPLPRSSKRSGSPGSTPRPPNACWRSRRAFCECCRICWRQTTGAPRVEADARGRPLRSHHPAVRLVGQTATPAKPALGRGSILVLERDLEANPVGLDLTVVDHHVLRGYFRNAQVAQRMRGALHGGGSGLFPGCGAGANDLDDFVDAFGHDVLLSIAHWKDRRTHWVPKPTRL